MSAICYYVRTSEAAIDHLSGKSESSFDDLNALPVGSEVIDIDKAYEALAWLTSPLKRAEAAHMTKLIMEPDWSDEDARASVARLDSMAVDLTLLAFEGRKVQRIDTIDFGMGGASLFRPKETRELAEALSMWDEPALRRSVDFAVMDRDEVPPGYWEEEGEDTFASYVLPALQKLKAFFSAATEAGQAVLIFHA